MSNKENTLNPTSSDSDDSSDSVSSSSSGSSSTSSSISSSSSSVSGLDIGELEPATPPLDEKNELNADNANGAVHNSEHSDVEEPVEPEAKRQKLDEENEDVSTETNLRSTTPPIENQPLQSVDSSKSTNKEEKEDSKSITSDEEKPDDEENKRSDGELEDNENDNEEIHSNENKNEKEDIAESESKKDAEIKNDEIKENKQTKDTTADIIKKTVEKPRSRSDDIKKRESQERSNKSKVDKSDKRDDRRRDNDRDRGNRYKDRDNRYVDRRRDRENDRYGRDRYDDRRRRQRRSRSRGRFYSRSRSRSVSRSDRRRKRRSRSTERAKGYSKRTKNRDERNTNTNTKSKTDEKNPEAIPKAQQRTVDILTSKTGGAYIPPAKLRMLQAEITDKSSSAYQRIAWEALKKSIHGFINKVNVDNIGVITRELLKENIVRGRGLICRSIIQAQAASPTFTHVYAALVAVINSKFPNIGELLLHRLVIQFKRGFRRNDKAVCLSSSRFIAHLVNQRVAHEILALEILTLLVETPTDDSVEVAIAFLKECGMKLQEVSSKGINAIFEMLKNILHEGKLEKRIQYMIEVVFQVRKDGFKDHVAIVESLELVEEDDQFTHLIMLDEAIDTQDILSKYSLFALSLKDNLPNSRISILKKRSFFFYQMYSNLTQNTRLMKKNTRVLAKSF